MSIEVTIPELGESITEAVITSWLKADGDTVAVDEPLCELETDKAGVELPSPAAGTLKIVKAAGETVNVGDTIAKIEEGASASAPGKPRRSAPAKAAAPAAAEPAAAKAAPAKAPPAPPKAPPTPTAPEAGEPEDGGESAPLSPAARRLVEEHGLDPASIAGSGRDGRLTKADVLAHIETKGGSQQPAAAARPAARLSLVQPGEAAPAEPTAAKKPAPAARPAAAAAASSDDDEERVRMTPLRRTIAKRLVGAQQTAAILTTFNEIDMHAVMDLRKRYKESFIEKHGVSLGFMSFFASACVQACEEVPSVNARIDGEEIVYSKRVHLGIAASTERGLVVPVVRNADRMDLADLEREIGRLADLARNNKLSLDDLTGGTFTISNGGVFGSMMSTPILNPPQSGILGMHKIEKRPVVVDDEIVIRPMMYVALSYDHRLVDGREAVTFLVRVKERIEDPERMLLDI